MRSTFLDFGDYPVDGIVISRVGWLPNSKSVFAYVQNRTQTWLDFVVWDLPTSKPRTLFRETTKAWVEDLGAPHFLVDGSFLVPSERSGWKHLYHFEANGKLRDALTSGDWEIHDVLRVDADAKLVYFTAAKTSSTGVDFCRVSFDGKFELLTAKGKTHAVTLPPSGPLFLDRYSDNRTPTQVAVVEAGGEPIRILDTNPVRERQRFRFGKYERIRIPTKDGFELEASITYPPDFDANKKYPIWMFTYAGPHTPTIGDGWGGGRMLENTLATNGIVVFRVDPQRQRQGGAIGLDLLQATRRAGTQGPGGSRRLALPQPVGRSEPRRLERQQLRRLHGGVRPHALQDFLGRHRRQRGHRLETVRHHLYRALHADAEGERGRLRQIELRCGREEPARPAPARPRHAG